MKKKLFVLTVWQVNFYHLQTPVYSRSLPGELKGEFYVFLQGFLLGL